MIALIAIAAAMSGADIKLPPDLAQAAHAYDAAQVKGDRAALERLLADDYLLVNSQGKLESKADLIADYTAPGFRLDPFTVEHEVRRLWPEFAPARERLHHALVMFARAELRRGALDAARLLLSQLEAPAPAELRAELTNAEATERPTVSVP